MTAARVCSECGSTIARSSRDGFCPRCLIELALKTEIEPRAGSPSRNPSPGPAAGTLGNYELIEPIGQGGMGVVYKARQRDLNRIVALKLMLSGPWATEAEIRRKVEEDKRVARSEVEKRKIALGIADKVTYTHGSAAWIHETTDTFETKRKR